jgi:hypothetical protein
MSRARLAFVAALLAALIAAAWLVRREPTIERAIAASPAQPERVEHVPSTALATPVPTASVAVASSAREAASTASAARTTDTASERRGAVVYGFLKRAKGRTFLVDGAVVLYDRFAERQLANCADDGAYAFSGLAPGQYTLSSRSPRNGWAQAEVIVDENATDKRIDLQLALQPEVVVKVVDETGQPFSIGFGAKAVATAEQPPEWFEELSANTYASNECGSFRPSSPRPSELLGASESELGTLTLDCAPPVFVSLVTYQRPIATKRVEPGDTEVVFTLDRASPALRGGALKMRLVDAATRAAVDALSVVLDGCGIRMLKMEDGGYRAANLQPGWYRIQVTATGYEGLRRRVLVRPGSDEDLGDLALAHEQWISGVVVDDAGKGSAIDMHWDEYDPVTGPPPHVGAVNGQRSESDGSFKISRLSRGHYILRASWREDSPWAEWSKVVDTRAGPVENVRIELVRGAPLVVRPSDPANARSVRFTILDGSGGSVLSSRLWGPDPRKIMLAPGAYTIEVRAADHAEPKRIPISLSSQLVDLAIP